MIVIAAMLSLVQGGPGSITIVRDPIVAGAPAFAGYVTQVSNDGHTLLTGGMDGTLQFWKLNGAKAEFLDALRIDAWENAPGHTGVAYDLSGDGKRFLVSLWNGRVEVWQRSPLKRLYAKNTNPPAFGMAGFHRFKPWLFVGSYGGKTERIDLDSGRSAPTAATLPMASVPGTTDLVTLGGLVDGATGKFIRKWKSKVENVSPVSVSPDGKLAVIGGEDPDWAPPQEAATEAAYARTQTLRVWRLNDGKLLCTMPGFATMGDGDEDIVWVTNTRVSVPGLGYVRDAITGKRFGATKEAQRNLLNRPLNSIAITTRKPSGTAQIRRLVNLPETGVRIIGIARGPNRSLAIWRDGVEAYRSPGLTVGAPRVITVLRANGTTKSIPVQNGFYGSLGMDEKGPYASQTFAGIKAGLITILSSVVRPDMARKAVDRIVIDPGKSIKRTKHSFGINAPMTSLFPNGAPAFPYDSLMVTFGEGILSTVSPLQPSSMDVWEAKTGRHRWTYAPSKTNFGTTTISLSQKRVAVGIEDYTDPDKRIQQLRILSALDGAELNRFDIPNLYGTSFSPDGTKLALMGSEVLGTIDFSLATPRLRRLRSPSNPSGGDLEDIQFFWSKDSRFLTVSTSLRPIQVFDTATGGLVATMRIFQDGTWLAIRADGLVDGTPSRLGMAKSWDGRQWTSSRKTGPFIFKLLGQ